MFKDFFKRRPESSLIYILFSIFFITEIIDDLFDHLLGNSILHSLIQIFLFFLMFYIVTKTSLGYHQRKINKLIPEEFMLILQAIKSAETKGTLINQRKLRSSLNITKPTCKKRVKSLIESGHIISEEIGNNKYLKLTKRGNSLIL